MQQVVLPIKDSNVLKEVQDTLLNNFKAGRRNYTVFQVGKATLLRVSDVHYLPVATNRRSAGLLILALDTESQLIGGREE